MQAVIELPLECPFELRILDVARMELEVIGVHGYRRILERDDDLDRFAFQPRVKRQQWMLIQTQVLEDAFKVLLRSEIGQLGLQDSRLPR